ncbi:MULTISPECIES: DUF1570 domain-containing protein [unclassified Pseudoalteromonas]|uniref:DUF1570 domain-containing protein n=1 Tax=unclassified Pseudoalteromonas TaxID=194690 RepID=UPI003014A19F
MTKQTCGVIKQKLFQVQKPSNNRAFALHLTGLNMNASFVREAEKRLWLIYHFYRYALSQSAQKVAFPTIQLNMHIAANESDYNSLIRAREGQPEGTDGMYFLLENQGFVKYSGDEKQALSTLVHEAVHALNFYFFGFTPRWVTEGLAVYFENLSMTKDNQFVIKPALNGWLTKKGLLNNHFNALDIDTLFNSEGQWQTDQKHTLYANAYLFTSFMHDKNPKLLYEYLQQERSNPCNIIPAERSASLLRNYQPTIESEYLHYQQQPVIATFGEYEILD